MDDKSMTKKKFAAWGSWDSPYFVVKDNPFDQMTQEHYN
jgi:hypothetical protein